MKVLIVDDGQLKAKKLIPFLTGHCSLHGQDVEVVHYASDARDRLRHNKYDLLLLDILLPENVIGDPSSEVSLGLLDEIYEVGALIAPVRIIGLTSDVTAAHQATPRFAEQMWTVIQVDPLSDDWLAPIGKCVDYMSKQRMAIRQAEYGCDLCVITALAEPEMEAVHRLPWNWDVEAPIDNLTFVRKGWFLSGGLRYNVVTSVARRMGMVSTALLAAKMINLFRPRFIVMAGICAGVEGKVNYGDVILADPTWDYQSGKRVKDKDSSAFSIAPKQLGAPDKVAARLEMFRRDLGLWSSIKRAWPSSPMHDLRLLIGPLASGSAVLADGQVVQEIKLQHRNLLGIEMEAYGLYDAASYASDPQPSAMAFKSVCDFADPDKKDSFQAYASYTSAEAVKAFFERYMHELSK